MGRLSVITYIIEKFIVLLSLGVQLIDTFHQHIYHLNGQNPMTDELPSFAFSAFTGSKNAYLIPAANTYAQVQFLFKSFMCS